jgi:hypothetical protein
MYGLWSKLVCLFSYASVFVQARGLSYKTFYRRNLRIFLIS